MEKKFEERFIIGKVTSQYWDFNKKETCMVCGLSIKDEEQKEKVYCPNCRNTAHKGHLIEWIKLKGICPLCRTNLNISDITSN